MTTLPLPGMEPPARVRPAVGLEAEAALAREVPRAIRFATSSWSFPGWAGVVYDAPHSRGVLAREGLSAYASHPLLRAAGVDRTYYAPMRLESLRAFVDAVPADFRLVCKAHEHCTWDRFPEHPRFGPLAGRPNSRFLDPVYAREAVAGPLIEGLGDRLGALVFQFPPRLAGRMQDPKRFAERLHLMLSVLPRGTCYAVELRTEHLLSSTYEIALRDSGATHCVSVHPAMPDLDAQFAICATLAPRPLIVRWNLGHGRSYDAARERYAPFDRMVDPDPPVRRAIATACLDAGSAGAESMVVVNNKAEGSAPASIRALAAEIVARRTRRRADALEPAVQ